MKDHHRQRSRRRAQLPCFFLLFFLSASTFFHFFFKEGTLRPKLLTTSSLPTGQMEAISGHLSSRTSPAVVSVQETVIFPDQVMMFLKYTPSTPLFTRDTISCVYSPSSSSSSHGDDHHNPFRLPPKSVDDDYLSRQIIRCPVSPRGFVVSISSNSNGSLPAGPTYQWDSLAYEAMIDGDNTTIVFVKGFNLRPGRLTDPSKFKCVYGWDFDSDGFTKFPLQSNVVSIAQEIVRCQTPLSILSAVMDDGSRQLGNDSVKVSVRMVGKRDPLKSVARLERRLDPGRGRKEHEMCICTMLRNQARFLREWVIYHSRIGVSRWFIYDNNSWDEIESVIQSLVKANHHNITRHSWPWIKTQEAGFAHCALRARNSCEWVGFIDVDEFLHLPSSNFSSLHHILANGRLDMGELRARCFDFGPSGQRRNPAQGVTVGYTCRKRFPERHKSIVRPEALNGTLMNMVHHFDLKSGYRPANLPTKVLVINHYKYQVWEVFKEKFYMRAATYVSDWQRDENVGSKDRTPGLGTKPVEPPNWSTRFCEVNDTGLHDRVLREFADSKTGKLPW